MGAGEMGDDKGDGATMKLEYLEYLVDFADTHSVAATANRFFISVQGMSRALHQIEKEYGVKLFAKQGASIALTPTGEQFVADLRPAMSLLRAAQGNLAGPDPKHRTAFHEIRIVATPIVLKTLLALIDLQSITARRCRILLREASAESCFDASTSPLTRTQSLGILSGPPRKQAHFQSKRISLGLEYRPLMTCEICIITSIHSPLANLKSISRSMLDTHPFGYFADDVALDLLDNFIRDDNLLTVTNDWSILERQLLEGRISTIVPKLFCTTNTLKAGLVTIPFDDDECKPDIGFVGTSENLANPHISAIMDFITQFLHENENKRAFSDCYTLLYGSN